MTFTLLPPPSPLFHIHYISSSHSSRHIPPIPPSFSPTPLSLPPSPFVSMLHCLYPVSHSLSHPPSGLTSQTTSHPCTPSIPPLPSPLPTSAIDGDRTAPEESRQAALRSNRSWKRARRRWNGNCFPQECTGTGSTQPSCLLPFFSSILFIHFLLLFLMPFYFLYHTHPLPYFPHTHSLFHSPSLSFFFYFPFPPSLPPSSSLSLFSQLSISAGMSGVFDKFMGSYVLLERQNLEEMLAKLNNVRFTRSAVLYSSAVLWRYFLVDLFGHFLQSNLFSFVDDFTWKCYASVLADISLTLLYCTLFYSTVPCYTFFLPLSFLSSSLTSLILHSPTSHPPSVPLLPNFP